MAASGHLGFDVAGAVRSATCVPGRSSRAGLGHLGRANGLAPGKATPRRGFDGYVYL